MPRLSRVNRRKGTTGYRRFAPPAFFRLAGGGFLAAVGDFRAAGLDDRAAGDFPPGFAAGFAGLAGGLAGLTLTADGSEDMRTRSKPSSAGR